MSRRGTGGAHGAPARGARAVLYLAGAAAIAVAVAAGDLHLDRVPLVVAAVLALVGLLGGRQDGPWGAAAVLGGAGLVLLAAPELPDRLAMRPDVAAAVGAAVGLVVVLLLELRGLPWGPAATLAAVVAVAATLARRDEVPALGRPGTWAAVLLLLGAVNLLLWARDRELPTTGQRR